LGYYQINNNGYRKKMIFPALEESQPN